MKHILLLLIAVFLTGCMSMGVFQDQIGMTEKQWLRRTLIADVAYMDGDTKVYRSNGAYYYFKSGILTRVDQGAQQINVDMTVRTLD